MMQAKSKGMARRNEGKERGGGPSTLNPQPPKGRPTPKPKASDPWLWLECLPVIWLALVITAYALLALQPFLFPSLRPTAEVPGIAEADRAVLPLLAALVIAGIIRYFSLRNAGRSPGAPDRGRDGP